MFLTGCRLFTEMSPEWLWLCYCPLPSLPMVRWASYWSLYSNYPRLKPFPILLTLAPTSPFRLSHEWWVPPEFLATVPSLFYWKSNGHHFSNLNDCVLWSLYQSLCLSQLARFLESILVARSILLSNLSRHILSLPHLTKFMWPPTEHQAFKSWYKL